jgi:hypothetical protein
MSCPPRGELARAGCARICVKLVESSTQLNVSADRARNVTLLLKVLGGRNRFTTYRLLVLANGLLCSLSLCFYFALERVRRVIVI